MNSSFTLPTAKRQRLQKLSGAQSAKTWLICKIKNIPIRGANVQPLTF